MVGTFAVVAVGEVTLDDARTQRHRAENRGNRMRVVGESQDHIREHGRIGLQHVDMQMIIVIRAGSVIGVALHQHQLLVDLQNRMDSLLHFANRGRARGDKERLAFACHALQRFDPVDFAGTAL